MNRKGPLPGGGHSGAAPGKRHPLLIVAATGCVVVLITEAAVHAPDGFGGAIVGGSALVSLVVGSVALLHRRRTATKAPTSDGSVLIAEIEAFLSGDYATYLRCRRREVPGWAWLNSFAHGELTTLREAQRSLQPLGAPSRLAGAEKAWFQAQSIVGRDLLRIVQDDPQRLTLVQQSILVPLELRLMELETDAGLTAYDLVQETRAALRPRAS
jgi:hypothetical protein